MKIDKKMLVMSLIILLIEIVIAFFVKDQIVRPYLGDILVVILIYTFIRIFDHHKIRGLAFYIFSFAVLVEVSQLIGLVELLGLESNKVAVIVMGSTFDIKDIICYAIGTVLVLIYEMSRVRRQAIERRKRQARRSRQKRTSEQNFEIFMRVIKRMLAVAIIIGALGALLIYGLNLYVVRKYDQNIITAEEAQEVNVQCIMVLGAGVWSGNRPSPILNDRLITGVKLYEAGVADRLLMSGDHGRVDYDEVNVMKQFAVDAGIEAETVFMDHAGFSTYDSMVRASSVFEVQKMVVVTQEYHLYRALYIANELGIEAYGVKADLNEYPGQGSRSVREVLARVKDFIYVYFEAEPTYLGDVIPIEESGKLTDDQVYE